jgi:TonB family protein
LQAARNDAGLTPWTGSAGLLLSIVLHGAVFFALGAVHVEPMALRDAPIEISVFEEPPPPPAPVVTPEPETPPAPEPPAPEPVKPPPKARERAPKPVEAPPPEPQAAPPAPAEETIADFTGTTLTGEGAGGWVSAVGSGAPMNSPIGRPGAAVTGRAREGVAGGVIGGTGLRLVGEADLSRKPKLPSQDLLNQALERHYPKSARQQGIEGSARIKLRVMPNGKLEPMRQDSESYPGFGAACMKAVREIAQGGHRAEPAIDRQGQPAAIDIPFNCTFSVD